MYGNLRVWIQRSRGDWLHLDAPSHVVSARTADEVPGVLRRVEEATRRGQYAAGYVAYEAAPAFDRAFVTRSSGAMPLAVFGLYEQAVPAAGLPLPEDDGDVGEWRATQSEADYREALRRIRDYIQAGDTYQVNYTMRLRAPFSGNPYALFHRLAAAQSGRHAAYMETDDWAVCSASPELFFDRHPPRIVCRPMKGTAPRGLWSADDEARSARLRASEKDRAENVMIVDMIRNDLGRVAAPGSVRVLRTFDVERYPTVFQMTSTVEAFTDAGLSEVFQALFPCASVTGAPKVRTMAIIRELESEPRGVYTGAIGLVEPGGSARFNVAIRTVSIDKRSGRAEYGVGGGIVWDSDAEREYQECLTKARVLTEEPVCADLLEALLWSPVDGFFLLDEHLKRLADSAAYFGFACDPARLRERLTAMAKPDSAAKVRVVLDRNGGIRVSLHPLPRRSTSPLRVAISDRPVDPNDRFLYHKTTRRCVYDAAKERFPGVDDVLLINVRNELTESTIANLVVDFDGDRVTPPLFCGLLPGTFREHLLRRGDIREAVVRVEDLKRATGIYLINSVRRWRAVGDIRL